MDRFTTALISKYTLKIPVKDDWFAPLVGDWDIRCVDAMRRETKGEWFFRRVLDGTGIEDLRLCSAMQPECAVTLRLYRADEGCYDAARSGEEGINRFRFTKENGKIIGANPGCPRRNARFFGNPVGLLQVGARHRSGKQDVADGLYDLCFPETELKKGTRSARMPCRLFLCEAVFDLLQPRVQRNHDLAVGTVGDLQLSGFLQRTDIGHRVVGGNTAHLHHLGGLSAAGRLTAFNNQFVGFHRCSPFLREGFPATVLFPSVYHNSHKNSSGRRT